MRWQRGAPNTCHSVLTLDGRHLLAKTVVYRGRRGVQSIARQVYELTHRGKRYRLRQDWPQDVPNEVADKLAKLDGQNFEIKEGSNG